MSDVEQARQISRVLKHF